MNLSFDVVLLVFIFMIYIDVIVACALLIGKLKRDIRHNDFELKQKSFTNDLLKDGTIKKSLDYTKVYKKMYESILISDNEMNRIQTTIKSNQKEQRYIKRLKSSFMVKRIGAAVHLGFLATENARLALQKAISKEGNLPAKLYMANSLCDIGNVLSIESLIDSLMNTKHWYRSKVNMLISNYGKGLYDYLPNMIHRNEIEIIELIVDFSSVYFSDTQKQYLMNLINHFEEDILNYQENEKYSNKKCCYNCTNCTNRKKTIMNHDFICEIKGSIRAEYCCSKYHTNLAAKQSVFEYSRIVYKAAEVMAEYYFKDFNDDKYLYHSDTKLNNIAIKALAKENSQANLLKLISLLENETQARASINAISNMIEKYPNFLSVVTDIFLNSTNTIIKTRLSEVLSIRIEYFILKLRTNQKDKATRVILSILDLGKTSKLITFANSNRDIDLENILVSIIKQGITKTESIREDFCKYLDPHIIQKCGLEKCCITIMPRDKNDNRKMIHLLYSLLIFSLLVVPCI